MLSEINEMYNNILERNMPHSWARVLHFVHLLSDANLDLYEVRETLAAILPLYIYFYHEEIRIYYSGTWISKPIFDDVINSMLCLRVLQCLHDTLLNIGIVLSTPTLGGKLVCAFDLWFEAQYVFTLQVVFVFFVRTVLDGFFGWPRTRRFYHEHVRGDVEPIPGWNNGEEQDEDDDDDGEEEH